MSQATVRFDLGAESVTVPLDITLPTGGIPLIGDVSGTFGDCFVAGDLNLTGNLFIEGVMTGIDTFHLQGNGFTVFFQNGGRADLHGKVKAAWGPWGTDSTGWVAGDRVAVAPTKAGVYLPSELAWSDWSMARPPNSPDFTFWNGRIVIPEVLNLGQSIVFENLSRGFHFHDSAGVQMMSDVKFLNCGTAGVLGSYPCHFHLLGDNSRGSVLERVVVEGGKNHAFVPHGSHGISFPGCAAYNTTGPAYWWDPPIPNQNPPHTVNNSDDIHWDDCLALWVKTGTGPGNSRTSGFALGAGTNLSCVGSVAACVQGTNSNSSQRSGFHWPENAEQTSWLFQTCIGHNNVNDGIFVWQNARAFENIVETFTAYRNGRSGINHGAYMNRYQYRGAVLAGTGMLLHAKSAIEGPLAVEDVMSEGPLTITKHDSAFMGVTYIRRCSFSSVIYQETSNGSVIHYEDCGLTPADFNLAIIAADSIIEIKEVGVLLHRWASGVWV